VEHLTKSMHKNVPNSEVIWYDSVTINGELKWQNQLNDLNSPYFDLCDGIFLNYTWNEEGLASSVLFDLGRSFDVYVGIDVFGRGCPGGGGFDSNQALTMIKYHSLSTAIFAPGWTHECAKEKDKFEDRDRKFWDLLEPLLYHQGLSMTSVQEQDLNPGSGCNDKDKCWWIDLCKQSVFPFRLNTKKYELSCDIPAKPMTICLKTNEEIQLNSISLKLFFDEEDPVIIKEAKKLEEQFSYQFEVEPPKGSQFLHFIQIENDVCYKIHNISIK